MPKLSASALKAKIAKLQKQLEAAEKNKSPAIKKVIALMKKLGVTLVDLKSAMTSSGTRGRPGRPPAIANLGSGKTKGRKNNGRAKGSVAIKYKDGQGNTWTGRGKTPRWLVAAEKAGKNREQFKV